MNTSPFKSREPKHKKAMLIFELVVSYAVFVILLLAKLGVISISEGSQIIDIGLFCFVFIIASLHISLWKENHPDSKKDKH